MEGASNGGLPKSAVPFWGAKNRDYSISKIYIGVLHFGSHNLRSAACLRFGGSYIWGQKLQRLFWVLTMGISSIVRLLSPFRMQVPHGGPACFCRFSIVLI